MRASNTILSFAFLVLFLTNVPTTSAWAVAFFQENGCFGEAYSVHSGSDDYTGTEPAYSRPGEDVDTQKCYWNKDYGLIQEPCTTYTQPRPRSFYMTDDTMCVVGVMSKVKDHYFGKGTKQKCNNLDNFHGRHELNKDSELVYRCRSLNAYNSMPKPKIQRIIARPPINGTTFSNGTTYSNTTDSAAAVDDEEWDDDDNEVDDDEYQDGEVPYADVRYDMWGRLLGPIIEEVNATAGVNATQGLGR